MKRGKQAHTDLIKACLSWFKLHPDEYTVWENKTRNVKISRHFVRFGKKGSSDIIGWIHGSGRFLAVECKIRPDKPTEAQQDFLLAVIAAGGKAIVVYDLDELEEKLHGGND